MSKKTDIRKYPWNQLSQEEKIEALHKQLQRIVRSVNHLGRLIAEKELT